MPTNHDPLQTAEQQLAAASDEAAARLTQARDDATEAFTDNAKQVKILFETSTRERIERLREFTEAGNQRLLVLRRQGVRWFALRLSVAAVLGVVIAFVAPWLLLVSALLAIIFRFSVSIESADYKQKRKRQLPPEDRL